MVFVSMINGEVLGNQSEILDGFSAPLGFRAVLKLIKAETGAMAGMDHPLLQPTEKNAKQKRWINCWFS